MDRVTKIPIEEATTPREGARVYKDRYWTVLDECILLYDGFAPQCNPNKDIAELVGKKLYPNSDIRFIETVFLPV